MTTNKALQTPANGSNVGTWDVPVNSNFTAIDTAFGGKATISTTGGTTVLSSAQYQPLFLVITGVLTSNAIIQFPSGVGGQWVALNSTTGAFTVTFSSAGGGASYALAQNIRTILVCDGGTFGVTLASNLAATAAPGGSNTQVQYNNASSLAGSANFTFDGTNIAVAGAVASGSLTPTAALAANYGGTGATVLTANNVILGNGTSAVQFVAPGATGNVLKSNGTTWTSSAAVYTPRVNASTANSATPTLNTDNYDMMVITGQTVAITSFTTNLSGTPVNGQKLWISITGTTAIALTWGASFQASTVALPTTTVTTARLDVGFVWNVAGSAWRCVAVA